MADNNDPQSNSPAIATHMGQSEPDIGVHLVGLALATLILTFPLWCHWL